MANATAPPRLRLRYDNLFFSGMAGVAMITILVGFARSRWSRRAAWIFIVGSACSASCSPL